MVVQVLVAVAAVAAAVRLGVAAQRHFDEFGVYVGRARPSREPDNPALWAAEIRRETHVELPCGGCLEEPQEAAAALRSRYGRREMFRRCLAVAFAPQPPETPEDRETVWSAQVILCQYGDARLLEHLLALRAEWRARPGPTGAAEAEAAAARLTRLEKLISGLCENLNLTRPPGIPKLERRDWDDFSG